MSCLVLLKMYNNQFFVVELYYFVQVEFYIFTSCIYFFLFVLHF